MKFVLKFLFIVFFYIIWFYIDEFPGSLMIYKGLIYTRIYIMYYNELVILLTHIWNDLKKKKLNNKNDVYWNKCEGF